MNIPIDTLPWAAPAHPLRWHALLAGIGAGMILMGVWL
jgi:hypothetical protein